MSGPPPSLAGLVGDRAAGLRERLGEPDADRPARPGRWLVWEGEGWSLRVRTGGGAAAGDPGEGTRDGAVDGSEARDDLVTSWSLAWTEGRPTLRAAVEPLGLWPAAAPDAAAGELDAPLARRGLEEPGGGEERSLTVTVRGGAFVRVAVFDEAPEW